MTDQEARLRIALTLVYAGLGTTAAVIGPSVPTLAATTGSDAETVTLATSALFAGLLAGVALSPVVARRLGLTGSLAAAAGLQAVALLLVPAVGTVGALFVVAGVAGAAFGVAEVAGTALVTAAAEAGSRLNVLTATFALSAIATPAVVGGSLAVTGRLWPAFAVIAAVQVVAAVVMARAVSPEDPPAPLDGSVASGRARAVAVLLVAYVGAEATLATWSTELVDRLVGAPASVATAGSTVFWAALAGGRLLAARVLSRRHAEESVLVWTLATAALASAGAALVGSWAAGVLLVVAVVAAGPTYALALASAVDATTRRRDVTAAAAIAIGAVGGVLVPAVAGPVARAGMRPLLVVVAGCLVVAALAAVSVRRRAAAAG